MRASSFIFLYSWFDVSKFLLNVQQKKNTCNKIRCAKEHEMSINIYSRKTGTSPTPADVLLTNAHHRIPVKCPTRHTLHWKGWNV